MGVLRVTLDSWQDMAQLDPTPPGGAPGDAVQFRVVCSPSLTGGAVLDSLGAGHAVTREEHAELSAPWQIDLLDPTGCTPSGWGWRVDVLTAIGRRATALLGPEMIADLPVVDGVRTVDLARWLGLGDPLPSGVVTAGAAGVAAAEAAASAEAAALSATAASSSASSASGSATTATSAASTATIAASSASESASAAASSASAASGSANAAATSATDAATARDEAQALVDTTVTSGEVVGDDLILKRADETTVNAGNVRGHQSTVPGPPGREVELRTTASHVQWRYVGDAAWTDLVPLASITGADGLSVELQTTATHIQWRLLGGDWTDLVALSALVGPAGPPNALTIGTVTTLPAGSAATASVGGTAPSQTLNLGLPTGAPSDWLKVGPGDPRTPATTSGQITGTEPNGCTYVSTDGGGVGGYRWVKRAGAWVCVEGDTGWRKLNPVWPTGYTDPTDAARFLIIRRVDSLVEVGVKFRLLDAHLTAYTSTFFPVGTAPVGFRPRNTETGAIRFDWLAKKYIFGVVGSDGSFEFAADGIFDNRSVRGSGKYTTTQAWPTALPGTAA